jgi:hypothetical protein
VNNKHRNKIVSRGNNKINLHGRVYRHSIEQKEIRAGYTSRLAEYAEQDVPETKRNQKKCRREQAGPVNKKVIRKPTSMQPGT